MESKGIKHCVVDSLSSISASFSEDQFRMFVRTLNGYLKSKSVTSLFLTAASTFIGGTTLTDAHLSTITDNIIVLRYVEVGGNLKHVVNVVKFRGSGHSKGLREYDITSKGIVIGQGLTGYEGIMTGSTRKVSDTMEEQLEREFHKFIGPMGASIFHEVKEKGLTSENILGYIDELLKDGVVKEEHAQNFKRIVSRILGGGTVSEEGEEAGEKIEAKSFAGMFNLGKKK